MSNRRPNHHRTGIIGQDYPIDPYRPDLHTAFDPYDRDWRTPNGYEGKGPSRFTDERAAWGFTPNNEDADYLGVYVRMRREKFLALAAPLPDWKKNQAVVEHMAAGGKVATPILNLDIPEGWRRGDFSQPAEVTGHEGRNRVTSLPPNTIENVILLPRYLRARDITPRMLEEINRRLYTENDDRRLPKRLEYGNLVDDSGRTGNPGDSGGFLWEFEGEPTTLQAVLEANPPGEPSNRLVRAAIAHFMRAAQNPAFQRGAVLFGGGAGADLVFSVRRAGVPAWSYDEQEADAQYIEALIDADPSLLTARRPLR
jgi:hypothetical protein